MKRVLLLALLMLLALPLTVNAQMDMTVYALTDDGMIITFSSANPGAPINSAMITGLADGDQLVGIDVRPATRQLFAVSSGGMMYTLNPQTGGAAPAGSVFTPTPSGGSFGFDFNPTVDRIRFVSNAAQNLRLNPLNGAVAAVDGGLRYNASDVNAGIAPQIVASAYTNNVSNARNTTLYNIDAGLDVLVRQAPPNDGVLNTIGELGVDVPANAGFDIATRDGMGLAGIGNMIYRIDLSSGAASPVGSLPTDANVVGLAIAL
ncbi:MAG: DUF4394 domain-containing protein [Blastochloris sp.]|nr:DUF4394 domain-containing protein [Blastochloris sp.]